MGLPVSNKKLSEPKDFPGRLFWLRSQTGLTQEEFGKRCKVTKGYISRLESGERGNPSDVFLRSCCDAFQTPLEWLENGEGQLPIVDPATTTPNKTPPDKAEKAWSADAQDDLTGFMRVLLEVVPMNGDTVLKLTAQVWESPELSDRFRQMLVLGANIAFGEKDQRKQAESK
jgi:transcriptional regulator with XRE-family HTH domain